MSDNKTLMEAMLRNILQPMMNELLAATERFRESVGENDQRIEARIDGLEARIALLETAKPPVYVSQAAGCVCPVGAELACGNAFCPRRGGLPIVTRATDGTAT